MQYSDLEQLCDHIETIEPDNHTTAKNWSAAQNFFHLASAFEGSMSPLPSGYPRCVRIVARPLRWIVTRHRFPPWLPIPAAIRDKLNPPESVTFEDQKARLLLAIKLFQGFRQDHPPHPVLGSLTRDEWLGFHLRHCEHHLSFIRLSDA